MKFDAIWEEVEQTDIPSLVPRVILQKVRNGLQVCYEELKGAVLFIDMTIVNDVTTFEDVGKGEEEGMSEGLNKLYDTIASTVLQGGGDIVHASGTQMIALWPVLDPDVDGNNAIHDVVSCALDLEKRISTHEAGATLSHEATRISCSYGSLNFILLGGGGSVSLGKWKYVVEGPAISQAAAVLRARPPGGGIIVTATVLARLQQNDVKVSTSGEFDVVHDISPRSKPETLLKSSPLPGAESALLTLFSWDSVGWALAVNRGGGELRTITCASIRLMGPSELTEETLNGLNKVVMKVQKALVMADGVLGAVRFEEGNVFLDCLLGLPLHTHADDSDRAVKLGLKIVTKLSGSPFAPVVVGIARGKCFCGLLGSPLRKDYLFVGEPCTTAVRLSMMEDLSGVYTNEETLAHYSAPLLGITFSRLSAPKFNIGSNVYAVENGEYAHSMSLVALEGIDAGSRRGSSSPSVSSSQASRLASARATSLIHQGAALRSGKVSRCRLGGSSTDSMRSDTSSEASRGSRSSTKSVRSKGSKNKSSLRGGKVIASSPRSSCRKPNYRSPKPSPRFFGSDADRPESPPLIPGSQGKLYGRIQESHAIMNMMYAIAKGKEKQEGKKVLHFKGAVQTGKTALLQAASKMGSALGIPVVEISGSESSRHVPYVALVPHINSFVESIPIHLIEMGFPAELRRHLPLLQHIVRLPNLGIPAEEHVNMDPATKVGLINEVLRALFKKFHGERIVFVVDDVQWVDNLTLSFFSNFLKHGGRMVIGNRECEAAGYDPSYSQLIDWYEDAKSSTSTEHGLTEAGFLDYGKCQKREFCSYIESSQAMMCPLGSLSHKACTQLLCSIFSSQTVDPELDTLLYSKCDGRPGFLTQMANTLLYGSLIEVEKQHATAGHLSEFEEYIVHAVPCIEAHVMQHIDTLPSYDRDLVSMAAVLGPCSTRVLQECLDSFGVDGNFKAALSRMASLDLLEIHDHGREVSFSLSLARDVMYYSTLPHVRRQLHSAVVRVVASNPRFDNISFSQHMRRSNLSEAELRAVCLKAFDSCKASCDIEGCYAALCRTDGSSMTPTPEKDTRLLLRAACCYENRQILRSFEELKAMSQRRKVYRPDVVRCCCFGGRQKVEHIVPHLQYKVLKLELDFWDGRGDSVAEALSYLADLDRLPVSLAELIHAASVVLKGEPLNMSLLSEIDTTFPILALCTKWDSRRPLWDLAKRRVEGCNFLPLRGVTESSKINYPQKARRKTNYLLSNTKFWRRSLWHLSCSLLLTSFVLTGDVINNTLEQVKELNPEWASHIFYADMLLMASSELNFGDVHARGAVRSVWDAEGSEDGEDKDYEVDATAQLLYGCLRGLSKVRMGRQWSARPMMQLLENCMGTLTPIHAVALWALVEALVGGARSGNMWPSKTSLHSLTSVISSEGSLPNPTGGRILTDSTLDVAFVLSLLRTTNERYPIVSLCYGFVMGNCCDSMAASAEHYRSVLSNAVKLGVPDCPLVWRTRVRLFLLDENDAKFRTDVFNKCSYYNPDMSVPELASALRQEIGISALLQSPEAKHLSTYGSTSPSSPRPSALSAQEPWISD